MKLNFILIVLPVLIEIISFCCGVPNCSNGQILLNEVVYDTNGHWKSEREFIELYDGGRGNVSLAGLRIVIINGKNGKLRRKFDFKASDYTDKNGYFVLSSTGKLRNANGILSLYCSQNSSDYNETLLDTLFYEFKINKRVQDGLPNFGIGKELINASAQHYLRQNSKKSPSISRCFCNTSNNQTCFADFRSESEGKSNNCTEVSGPDMCEMRRSALYSEDYPSGAVEDMWNVQNADSAIVCALRCFDHPLCDSFKFHKSSCKFISRDNNE